MRSFILFFFGVLLTQVFQGCGEERGCTDPRSDFYVPTAEMDDGSCQESIMEAKFVGTWTFMRPDSVYYTATITPSESGGDFKVFFMSNLGYAAQNVNIQPAMWVNREVAKVLFWDVSGAGNGSLDSMIMVKTGPDQADLYCYLKGFAFIPNGLQKHTGIR
jgi:hypothetical protein